MLSKARGGRPKTAPATESATNSSQTDGNQEQSNQYCQLPQSPVVENQQGGTSSPVEPQPENNETVVQTKGHKSQVTRARL